MKKTLLSFLAGIILAAGVDAQTQIIWSDSFTTGVPANSTQMAAWSAFTAQLTPRTYTKVIIKGTFDQAGKSCSDSTVVTALANALYTNTDYISPASCNGNVWHNCASHGYQGEVWLDPPSACSGANCPTGYIIRPNIGSGNPNWGGVNTATCSGPTQRMTLIFEYGTVTGVGAEESALQASVYPNPFNNTLSVGLGNAATGQIIIYNVLGEQLYAAEIAGDFSMIDTSELAPGVYFITIRTDIGTITRKIVKE
ncbi:MAG: T9SS type A sorting domain-containing protein [Bacteroidota bacterium]